MATPVRTKKRPPSLVSCPLRTAGFPTRGLCCAPQQADQEEKHGLFLSCGAAPMLSPRDLSLHHLVTGYQRDTKGLAEGG